MKTLSQNRRISSRIPIRMKVEVQRDAPTAWITSTRDISDTGVFLFVPEDLSIQPPLSIGETIWLQVLDSPEDAPKTEVTVVRTEDEGVGVCFA